MSLEAKIQELTETVARLIDTLQTINVSAVQAPSKPKVTKEVAAMLEEEARKVAPPAAVTAPTVAAESAVVAESPSNPMPPLPSFDAATAPSGAPFSDGKGLIDYVMSSYKALGPQKGAQIQAVLTSLGYANINDVKSEHYGALFAGVESLK